MISDQDYLKQQRKSGSMGIVSDDKLKELVVVYEFLVQKTLPLKGEDAEINKEYMDVLASLRELQVLRVRVASADGIQGMNERCIKRLRSYNKTLEENREGKDGNKAW